eukprot:CAMPEP_0170517332 /NCGR_PEP_ID=MMETSP0209-20121228/3355_1 /TAXON_ID=665100 ORGANISM="Litonotus pictus, Strain P1" /NCGR_SAMPLE_ID=MMETSP0209 /ASSEMBLY_ACC=CAM_ASM_000301 /LENGTH=445 /DNA_ID=CAMNT_0010802555 /DNA_START=26 /DNA_END=1363 /DNA_ORIENTATION=-
MTTEGELESNTEIKLKEELTEVQPTEEQKQGEYLLSTLQVILINKKMPPGYKIEFEETYLKTASDGNGIVKTGSMIGKKRKTQQSYDDKPKKKAQTKKKLTDISGSDYSTSNPQNASKKRSAREKKPNHKDDLGYVETKVKCKDPKLIEVSKRCEKILFKLKKHNFYDSFSNGEPPFCLSEVDKKVRNFQYSSIHIFGLEIRKIWKYWFSSGNSEMYDKALEISEYFETIFTEAEENPPGTETIHHINKKLEKLESQIQMNMTDKMKPPAVPMQNMYLQKQASRPQVPLAEKPMTITEKNILGNNIRMLTPDQMKGIINILSDQYAMDKSSKYFEFDLDKLNTKKLREIEKYVRKSIKTKATAKPSKPESLKEDTMQTGSSLHRGTEQQISQGQPPQESQTKDFGGVNSGPPGNSVSKGLESISLSSSKDDDDSESLSSLDFKKA